ncbi:RecQ helicase [Chondrus crispus]|uniref:RecQ helicase n=1 Tax=Chondrus crispus TaxID=2769 RepID=R7QLT4_CHOCR|nr:RecQ helicase [Chondrus crispus]CDF38743.1 RecQ helicase [Chondrus crispus]|eukprot:XP_005718648.1 RecQ helicase [Chondrus crispus]
MSTSRMRFDKHLQNNDLLYNKAFQLASISNTQRDKYARRLMASYHKRAFDTTERKVYIKAHSFMDSDLSLSLSNSAVDLYDARTSRLLSFLFASCVDESSLFTHLPGRSVNILTHLSHFTNSTEDESLALLHELLLSLFFEAISDEEDGFILFISCSSVFSSRDKTSFRLGTANEVSPMIAALKHLAKCVAVTELYIKGPSDTTEGWERIAKATQGNLDTGVCFVQYCIKVCHRVRDGEMQKVRFILYPRHHHCAIVDGIELSLSKLGEKMKALQRKAWYLLSGGIINGLVITADFWQACAEMQDTFTDRTPSYWFASHRANFHVYRHWSHALKDMLQPVILDGQGNFNLKKTKDFINKCEELQRVIYVLPQICSGAPARASEVGAVQICNSSTACHNLYLSNGQLFSAIFYHKSRNMHEGLGKPIVRYPDAVTAGIIMAYLIVVRPVEGLWH